MMPPHSDDEIIYVPVRRAHFEQVQAFAARLQAADGSESASSEAAPALKGRATRAGHEKSGAQLDHDAGWDEPSLRDLVRRAHPKQRRLLELLARKQDEKVWSSEIQEYVADGDELPAYPGRALGQLIAALGKRCKPYGKDDLPFQADWDHEMGSNWYRMSARQAEIVLSALDSMRDGP